MIRGLPSIADLDHYVYRAYGHDDRLLYVGSISNPKGRIVQHRSTSRWAEVIRVEISNPMPYAEAFHAEQQAIVHERPAWNRARVDARPLREIKRALAIRLRLPLRTDAEELRDQLAEAS